MITKKPGPNGHQALKTRERSHKLTTSLPLKSLQANPNRLLGPFGDHLIDQAVIFGLFGGQVVIALGVFLNFLKGLTGALGQDLVQLLTGLQNFPGMDLNFSRLSLCAAQGLMDHHLGVGQRKPLAFGACSQQKRTHACGHAYAQGRHVGLDEIHGVKDGHASADRTTG